MSKPVRRGGKWRVRWVDESGKRRSGTFTTEAAARAALRRRMVEVDEVRSGLVRPRSTLTVAQAAPDWLAARPAKRRKDDDSRLKHHILPFLGTTKLGAVSPQVLERFVRHLESKVSARTGQVSKTPLRPMTIKNVLITLCKMLGDLGFPQRVKYTVPTSGYAWIQDPAHVGRFLDECRPAWFRIAAGLAVYAGLRKGEVAGLRRGSIFFDHGLIRVERSYEGPVKNKRLRWVPLAPELAALLRPWLLAHATDLVVTLEGDAPIMDETDVATFTRRACKRAGVSSVNFHQLRHTFASHLAQRKSLAVVGAMLGHADPRTTSRYAHLDTESLARDPKLHLSFTAPDGDVVQFHAPSNQNPDAKNK